MKPHSKCRLLLVAAFLGISLVIPPPAHATPAVFTVEYCDSALPGGNPPLFESSISWGYFPVQTCASPGGALAITQPVGVTDYRASVIVVRIPVTPGGFIEDETISGYVSDLQAGNMPSVFESGWPLLGGGDTARKFIIRDVPPSLNGRLDSGGSFGITMGCARELCNPGGTVAAHYIAVTQVDPVPPIVPKVEGSLLSGEVQRGHQSLTGLAGDTGGGVSRVEVLVNGLPAAPAAPGACAIARVANPSVRGLVATSPTPCPTSLPASWTLDTAAYPFQEGDNTVQVCASDLSTVGSPNTGCSEARTVKVDNACAESEVPGGQVLSASFAATNSETVTVPYGQPAEVKGELENAGGNPISGATICIHAQTEGEPGEPAPVATAKTDANGQFAYQLPAGPNRRVLIGYRHDSFQVGRTMSFKSHSKPALQVNPGRVREGGRVKITGFLPGPNAAGRVIVLQASALHGRRWLTFRRATTGAHGGFRATYRFGKASSTITYKLRAAAPPQSGYPYAAGHSRPALVKVLAGGEHHPRHDPHRKQIDSRSRRHGDLELIRNQGTMAERVHNQVQTDDQPRRTK